VRTAVPFPVSNSNMRLLWFAKRAVLAVALLAMVLVAGVSVHLRVEQYRFRRGAEQLLSDVRKLELKKESADQVKVVLRKWRFDEWGRAPGQPCTEDECIYRLELVPKAALGHILLNPFHSGFLGRPLAWLGLRPAVVHAWVGIRRKELTSISFSVWTVGRGCDARGRPDCTVMGYADTKQRETGWSSHQQPDVKLNQFLLHPNYLVGAFPEWLNADAGGNPAVIIWAESSPATNTLDVSRLMQFDLSCLTRFLSCRERDLMPAVWAQTVEDIRHSPKLFTCTPELSKRVAQLADAIAVVRPRTVELSAPPSNGRSPQFRDLEIINVIKKPGEYEPQLTNVHVDKPEIMIAADTGSPLRAGQEYVFFLQVHNTPHIGWIALYQEDRLTLTILYRKMRCEKIGLVPGSIFSGERVALPRVHPFPRGTFLTASGKGFKSLRLGILPQDCSIPHKKKGPSGISLSLGLCAGRLSVAGAYGTFLRVACRAFLRVLASN
jgi:hypothetical protein